MVELFEEIVLRKRKLLAEQLELVEAREVLTRSPMFPAMRSTEHLILTTKLKMIDELIEDVSTVRSIISVKETFGKDCESCSISGSNEQCVECNGNGIV